MTVAVSTSSALDQLASLVPQLDGLQVEIGVGVIALITIGNLRGLRESGNIFAVPTYAVRRARAGDRGDRAREHRGRHGAQPLPPQADAVPFGTEPLGSSCCCAPSRAAPSR